MVGTDGLTVEMAEFMLTAKIPTEYQQTKIASVNRISFHLL